MIDYDKHTYISAGKPRKKRKGLTPELELQISIVTYYDKRRLVDPTLRHGTRLYAVNPIPGKTMTQAVLSKRAGLRRGVFDLCLLDKRGKHLRQVWIECKAPKGRLTPEQADYAEWLSDTWIQAHTVESLDQFISILEA